MDIVRGSSINHALSGFDVRSTESHLRGRRDGRGEGRGNRGVVSSRCITNNQAGINVT